MENIPIVNDKRNNSIRLFNIASEKYHLTLSCSCAGIYCETLHCARSDMHLAVFFIDDHISNKRNVVKNAFELSFYHLFIVKKFTIYPNHVDINKNGNLYAAFLQFYKEGI